MRITWHLVNQEEPKEENKGIIQSPRLGSSLPFKKLRYKSICVPRTSYTSPHLQSPSPNPTHGLHPVITCLLHHTDFHATVFQCYTHNKQKSPLKSPSHGCPNSHTPFTVTIIISVMCIHPEFMFTEASCSIQKVEYNTNWLYSSWKSILSTAV